MKKKKLNEILKVVAVVFLSVAVVFAFLVFIDYAGYYSKQPTKCMQVGVPDCQQMTDPVSNETYTECRIVTAINSTENSVPQYAEYAEPSESRYQVMKEMNKLP